MKSMLQGLLGAIRTRGAKGTVTSTPRTASAPIEALESRRLLNAGGLDPTFGKNGIALEPSQGADTIIVQSTGKYVVAVAGANSETLQRFNIDGAIDHTFHESTIIGRLSPHDLALAPGDKIVVAGANAGSAISRFNADGTLDATFNATGTVDSLASSGLTLSTVAVQPDGKIVAAISGALDPTILRLNPNGSLDNTFGVAGQEVLSNTTFGHISAILVEANGKIALAGYFGMGSRLPLLMQLNADGTQDNIPFQTPPLSGLGQTNFAIAQATDGSLIVTGFDAGSIRLVRYQTDGHLLFAIQSPISSSQSLDAEDVQITPDQKIVVGGEATYGASGPQVIFLARYDLSGNVDPTFGDQGFSFTPILKTSELHRLAITSDAKVIVAGGSRVTGAQFAVPLTQLDLIRYTNDASNADTISPTATFDPRSLHGAGTSRTFTITYRDNVAIDTKTLGVRNITVTDPTGFSSNAVLVRIVHQRDGSVIAHYRIRRVGLHGAYSISANVASVADTSGNFLPPQTLGGFLISRHGRTLATS